MSPPRFFRRFVLHLQVLFCRHRERDEVFDEGSPFMVCHRCGVELPDADNTKEGVR